MLPLKGRSNSPLAILPPPTPPHPIKPLPQFTHVMHVSSDVHVVSLIQKFFFPNLRKKTKFVIIVGVMRPHMNDVMNFHPTMDIYTQIL